MKVIGNIIWLIITGITTGILWIVEGVIWCVTIVGIPFGIQAFKIARLAVWPFGKEVKDVFHKHPIANLIWVIFGGLALFFAYLILGVVWCITIIGIPFGKQCFKLAKLAIGPFGAEVV
ncbi:MAG: YccF domain-containing protein [Clostridia bacterium]|nr:YccF domain-containing protein [Clostridia bacterium]